VVSWPTRSELIGGLISKGPGLLGSIAWWANLLFASNPVIFGMIVVLSVALEAFHGVWVHTWQEFQAIIGSRGFVYQTVLNVVYMQLTLAAFRMLTWVAIPSTALPWHLSYWRDVSIMTVVGSVSGTLGYRGLNALYDKGRMSRRTRSGVLQGRDFLLVLTSAIFASNSMALFWIIFSAQQLFDCSIFVVGRLVRSRPAATQWLIKTRPEPVEKGARG
jgi:hypothetical protein